MPPISRLLVVAHVACRYRLLSLLPPHPARPFLVLLQYCLLYTSDAADE